MNPFVFDLESNGLYNEVDKIWCLCGYSLVSESETTWIHTDTLSDLEKQFHQYDMLIGHNIIQYDLPVLKKVLGIEPKEGTVIIDTLLISRLLNPDRWLPNGCPKSIKDPITGKTQRVGPHSLHAWGYRVMRAKPSYYDWQTFTPEMVHRCKEDVMITRLVYGRLLKEMEA